MPGLDDPSVDEHDRAVGELDGREPLRRDEHGAALERRPQPLDEAPLGERVDGRERIVEHDDARTGDERARERDALALAAGEIDAALADERVVAVRQLVGERVDAGRLARGEHLVPVGVVAARSEVLAQRHREEHGPLRHERDGGAKLGDRQVARVDAADEHAPAGRVVEAREQVEQRRLAGAGRRRRSRRSRRAR